MPSEHRPKQLVAEAVGFGRIEQPRQHVGMSCFQSPIVHCAKQADRTQQRVVRWESLQRFLDAAPHSAPPTNKLLTKRFETGIGRKWQRLIDTLQIVGE